MEHWIKEVRGGGKLITLEDESVWEISFLDRIHTSLWLPMQIISITERDSVEYTHKLININMKKAVAAKRVSN